MNEELYFTPHLTECEHWTVEELIRNYCNRHQIEVVYYRQFKNGHVSLYRECKVIGDKIAINRFKCFLDDNNVSRDNYNAKDFQKK